MAVNVLDASSLLPFTVITASQAYLLAVKDPLPLGLERPGTFHQILSNALNSKISHADVGFFSAYLICRQSYI